MLQNKNPLNNTTIQMAIAAAVFIVVMLTVGQSWDQDQIVTFFFFVLTGFGITKGLPMRIGGFESESQTAPPTSAPISQEEQDLRIKVRQYEQDIEMLLLAQDERDALVYTFNQLGLRVTVRVNR